MELGYVGLGAMGGALARRLMLSHRLRVLDLRQDVVADFAKDGAIPVQDGSSLAAESDAVLLCLPRSADVRAAAPVRPGHRHPPPTTAAVQFPAPWQGFRGRSGRRQCRLHRCA